MVSLLQTEKTYEVEYKGKSYTMTILEDFASGYIQYDIFDDNGIEVRENQGLELELINYLENNID
jgi:hypothetical protein